MLLQNGHLKVRKLQEDDNQILATWLSDPSVLEFYEGRDNPFDVDRVNETFYTLEDHTVKCIVEFKHKPIGYIQFYQLDDQTKTKYGYSEENIYGTDQFIGEINYWNKGIGTLLVSSMVKYLLEHREASRIVLDPQARNTRAIKCYENCGFNKVKMLHRHELHEGVNRDCWLMEYVE